MFVQALLFFIIPLLLAGIIHHFFIIRLNLFSFLATPIDNNLLWLHKPVFGQAKTWRGLIVMALLGGLFTWFCSFFVMIQLPFHPFLFGTLLGSAYSLGELPNSFIKRRLSIKPSQRTTGIFGLIDQIDSVIASSLIVYWLYQDNLVLVMWLIILGGTIHLLVDQLLHTYSYKSKNL